jgi:nucleotide-binding universal stress UspA family protein
MAPSTRARRRAPVSTAVSGGNPVLLATLGVPFDDDASAFAVDAALESGQTLIVANITRLEPLPLSVTLGYDSLEELTPELSKAVRAPAELARSLGVRVERLHVRSPRPVRALLEVVEERRPGLLVFGPGRELLPRRRYARAAKAIRAEAHCLVWLPG